MHITLWSERLKEGLLGKTRRRWEDNIEMDLVEIGCEDMEWIQLAEDGIQIQAVVGMIMNH
jgi:hypothetical protein